MKQIIHSMRYILVISFSLVSFTLENSYPRGNIFKNRPAQSSGEKSNRKREKGKAVDRSLAWFISGMNDSRKKKGERMKQPIEFSQKKERELCRKPNPGKKKMKNVTENISA